MKKLKKNRENIQFYRPITSENLLDIFLTKKHYLRDGSR